MPSTELAHSEMAKVWSFLKQLKVREGGHRANNQGNKRIKTIFEVFRKDCGSPNGECLVPPEVWS